MTGTGALVRLILRRDRIRLSIWVLGTLALIAFSAAAVQSAYDTPQARAAYAATITGSAASVFLVGPPVALDTTAGITMAETAVSAYIAVTLMAMFLTMRHTRAEEEDGRLELLRATVVGRQAQLASTAIVVGAACLLVGAGIAATFLGMGLPTEGSLLFGTAITVTGWMVIALTACLAQVTEHARGGLGLTGAIVGVAYAVRGIGDIQALDAALKAAGDTPVTGVDEVGLLCWFSPYGWAQATHPFGADRWWPLLLVLALTAGLAALSLTLLARRDLGAGLVSARPGPATASDHLDGVVPLTLRLQRATLAGWLAGMAALGVLYGSLGNSVAGLIEDNPSFEEMFGALGTDPVRGYFATATLINALIATGFTLGSVTRLRADETRGRAEAVLAGSVSRWEWGAGPLLMSTLGTIVLMAVTGLFTGLAAAASTGDGGWIGSLTGAALVFTPAMLVLAGFAVLLMGWLPRATSLAWVPLVLAVVVGWFGPLLKTPDWLNDLSPFTHVPEVPAADLTILPLAVLSLVAVALGAAGLVGLRRRDVST